MSKENLKIGNILKVSTKNHTHYEIVVQIKPEVLTETITENEDDEQSQQGLCENWIYEIIPYSKIISLLNN